MANAYLSQTSGYIQSHEATGKMIVDFSRNPDSFSINKYAQIVPVTQTTGAYMRFVPNQAYRMIDTTVTEYVWGDGQAAPTGSDNHKEFSFQTYFTKRRPYSFTLGDKTVKETPWDAVALYSRMAAQEAMTTRSYIAAQALATSGNYGATGTATSIGGGKWDVGTATTPYILNGLNAARLAVHRNTGGVVRAEDMILVVGPALALLMSQSQEIHAYLKESPFALAQIRGDAPNQNKMWGLPETIYGASLVVEDTVIDTAQKGATAAPADALGATVAAVIGRPGGLEGTAGGPAYSFLSQFMLEEMTTEVMDDPINRRTIGRVVEDYDIVATAPLAGYLITAVSG